MSRQNLFMISACDSTTVARSWVSVLVVGLALLLGGCDAPQAEFTLNLPFLHSKNVSAPRDQEIANILAALFGTPDEPYLMSAGEIDHRDIVDPVSLKLSAGPVSRDEFGTARGLYREHCVHCHGISGNGAGPTAAFLNPYPRDFRKGQFKFKSTPSGVKPTHDDLKAILVNGIAGTAMPSFAAALSGPEIDALVDYVKYLTIRGQVERSLCISVEELEDGDAFDLAAIMEEAVAPALEAWKIADQQVLAIPPRPDDFDTVESLRRGREFYFGVGGCVKCHGDTQLGDGVLTDYDDWTKDYKDWGNLPVTTPEQVKEKKQFEETYYSLGGLPLRNIKPRNLRHGIYRGGRRPIDIYRRVRNGIEGSPMPAAAMRPPGAGPEVPGLTESDLWDIVNYVRHLPYEPMSRPRAEEPLNDRPPR
ncbi:MAG: c-type cytochrome [Planctomycetota bacterium]|nr:c-type cytochrome [Planctomycetota bacterium]MDA1178166.1 c-type cytochrome [Planctomycetota bacterium]